MRKVKTIVPNILYQGARPGYYLPNRFKLNLHHIYNDVSFLQDQGIKSILCLLQEGEMQKYYNFDLLQKYQDFKFAVYSYPVNDDKFMGSMKKETHFDLNHIWRIFEELPKPIYLHCSAGCMRSYYLAQKLYEKYIRVYGTQREFGGDFGSPFVEKPRLYHETPYEYFDRTED